MIFLFRPRPFSIAELAEFLGIEISEVSRFLVHLQTIVDTQGIDQPVTMRHKSIRDFLRSETHSGTCFVSRSDNLRLGYYCFIHNFDRLLHETATVSPAISVYSQRSQGHHIQAALTMNSRFFTTDLGHFPHLPHQTLPYHLFSFVMLFFQIFGHLGSKLPVGVLQALTKSIESLALAVECDTAPGRWLNFSFRQLGFEAFMREGGHLLNIHQEQATALQHNVQRIETALRVKVLLCFIRQTRAFYITQRFSIQCSNVPSPICYPENRTFSGNLVRVAPHPLQCDLQQAYFRRRLARGLPWRHMR
jgi:hypothetical protein